MKCPGCRFLFHVVLLLAAGGGACLGAETNLIFNGSFAASSTHLGQPNGWSAAGNPAVQQQLTLDHGPGNSQAAKLVCSAFSGDGPDYHAMLCQVGKVSLRRGQWYRLSFQAKAEHLQAGAVEVALTNTRFWENGGLGAAFTPTAAWQPFSFVFRARQDLPSADSRLQFWFKSTGTLWLAEASLTESAEGQQWFPQVDISGVKNFIPNSSFECGLANWGSFTWGLSGWAGNLYRLEGDLECAASHHGGHSLRISLSPTNLPVFYFDYYDPVRQPVRRVLAANRGWFRVQPGQPLTLSAWLKADAEGVIAQLAANEAPNHLLHKPVTVGTTWQRYAFTFTPSQPFLFIALGPELEASQREAATLWVDSVQLERGSQATAYEPRQAVEAFLETSAPGNLFTNPPAGLGFTLRAFNDADQAQRLHGRLQVTDFFDRNTFALAPALNLPPHASTNLTLNQVCPNQQGFFRATWSSGTSTQALRCAVFSPTPAGLSDSPFGFNHAYPWDFLVHAARQAGVLWWRDWSAKWQTIEPQPGRLDFSAPDLQIQRVLALNGQVEVLLPFPSASWCTTADAAAVDHAARDDTYLRTRLPFAYAPTNLNDFGHFAAAVAQHYLPGALLPGQQSPGAGGRGVNYYQILNEPLYTDYALPRRFGYAVADYIRLCDVAARALHALSPQCRVVGGPSAGLSAGVTRDFIAQGGLEFLDVFDLHLYDAPRPAEAYVEPFAALAALMREHGGPKPVWISEWGCYADDDPASIPEAVGDDTMNRCRWSSERAATEHLVKFSATAFAHGVRKLFFHAGTCGTINEPDAGGVLFTYGGAPRKMYAGVATLTRLLGVPEACLKQTHADGLHVCIFRAQGKAVAVAWCEPGQTRALVPPPGVTVYDIMGNVVSAREASVSDSPLYLIGAAPDEVLRSIAGQPR